MFMRQPDFETGTLEILAEHLDFQFDPAVCATSTPNLSVRYPNIAIAELGDMRYAKLSFDRYGMPPYDETRKSGVVQVENRDDLTPDWWDEEEDGPYVPDPDSKHDKSLHGLFDDREGEMVLYDDHGFGSGLYGFRTVNGSGGMNNLHQLLGRSPGVDIPRFTTCKDEDGHRTAGQITEAIANMEIVVPAVSDFWMAEHDLGAEGGTHGPSWPHTHPHIYKHLSHRAQDIIDQDGDRIHSTEDRSPEVVVIAKALDKLIFRLRPVIEDLAVTELRIRDGRYSTFGDTEIINGLMKAAFKRCRKQQGNVASGLLLVNSDASESERYRRGYWAGMQLMEGVIDTRLALHEGRPHPEATDEQTARAMDILGALKKELERRFSQNREHLIAG